ncbi:MAG: hypothetical protein FWG88_07210 [Oscillospiraceae bacterium]|nr:hypothetical protein [Oscillospiraceae bacterium]
MKIGIDIDGVLTDIHGFHRRHAPEYFMRKYQRMTIDDSLYDVQEMFGCPPKEFRSYWKRHWIRYVINEPARKDAGQIVRKFLDDGHTIYIISKRAYAYQKSIKGRLMRAFVRNWLYRNDINYEEVIFCDHNAPESKRAVCLEKDLDVMIDDDPENISVIAPVAKVICYDAPYNRDCRGENILRAIDWNTVYMLVSNMDNNNESDCFPNN